MKIINLNKQDGVKLTLFPDNQPHVTIQDINRGDEVIVLCSMQDSLTLFNLLQVCNALDHIGAKKIELRIPYLMGARYDRIMNEGDSLDIEVVANLINSMNFEKVSIFDVHSDVSLALIKNSNPINNMLLVMKYKEENAVLICPDAGAAKKISKYFEWNQNLTDVVYCIKNRNTETGELTLKVLEPEKCKERNCIIIDDICDGGRTFAAIANQLPETKSLTLMISHGIFSAGMEPFKRFDEIITTNSRKFYSNNKIKVHNIF